MPSLGGEVVARRARRAMQVSGEGVFPLIKMRCTALRRMESCCWRVRGVGRIWGGALGAAGTATCTRHR